MDAQLERLLKNYCNVRQNYEAWCFMVNANLKVPQSNTSEHIRNNKLLSHLCYLSIKDFYLEFYKILKESPDNSDNIFTLLKNLMETNPIKKKEAELNLEDIEKNRIIITQLCNQRDKYFAHLDKDFESNTYSSVTDIDINKVFTSIEKAIVTLTSLETLVIYLEEIPSRDDFKL